MVGIDRAERKKKELLLKQQVYIFRDLTMIKHDKIECLVKIPVDMDCSLVGTLQMCTKTRDRATFGEEVVDMHTGKARIGSRPKGQKHQMSTLALVELYAFRISQLR